MAGVQIKQHISKQLIKLLYTVVYISIKYYGNNSTKRVNCLVLLFLNNTIIVVIHYQYEKFIALNGIQCDFW